MVGKTLSHYKIIAELGRGGMGVVYRAEDTKLNRTVAIKVLPPSSLSSEDDRERFYREARAAAALTHPHIAVIHEIDEAVPEGAKDDDLRPFIAMEFIDGETLEERIKSGPLKINEAIRIASEIADALKAAHGKDIVHRDIKSANIMLDADERSKVLDFGLAKTAQSTMLTRMGSTLGTIAYMSPEQSRGEEVDARADIWALGIVLYEMIAGQRPFGADYEQAVVYSILNEEAEPLSAVRTGVPFSVESIVEKCLRKEARLRYQTAADVMADLEAVKSDSGSVSRTAIRPPASLPQANNNRLNKSTYFWIAGLITVVAFALFLGRSSISEPISSVSTFVVASTEPVDSEIAIGSIIAPGGQRIVLSADGQLWIREISDLDRRPLPGTERATLPFWAPDSQTIGFHRDGSLWKVDVSGGAPTLLAALPEGFAFGAAWTEMGLIYLTMSQGSGSTDLFWIPERGGQARPIEFSDSTNLDASFFSPVALPGDGGIVIFQFLDSGGNRLIRIDGQETFTILENVGLVARAFDESGILFLEKDGAVHVLPYDPGREPVEAESTLLIRDAQSPSVSRDGSLLYMRPNSGPVQFRWVAQDGRVLEPIGRARVKQMEPIISRDGSSYIFRAVPDVRDNSRAISQHPQLFIHHIEQETESQLTTSESVDLTGDASLSEDGQRIAFSLDYNIYTITTTGTQLELLKSDPNALFWPSWTSDGQIVFGRIDGAQGDLWIKDPSPDSTARLLFSSAVFEAEPEPSPDGRYLAYIEVDLTDLSGEVFIRDFLDLSVPGRRLGRGLAPRWSAAGDALFFLSTDSMYRWNVPTNLSGTLSDPVALFGLEQLELASSTFDVTPDGQQFLMPFASSEAKDNTILVQNWKKMLDN